MKNLIFTLAGTILLSSVSALQGRAQQPPRFGEAPSLPPRIEDRDRNGVPDHRQGPGRIGGITPGNPVTPGPIVLPIEPLRPDRPHRPGIGIGIGRPHPGFGRARFDWQYYPGMFAGHRIIDFNGKRYIDTPDFCGITQVAVMASGSNIVLNNLEIIFGDGGYPQNLVYGAQVVRQNSYSPNMDLDGYARCINGFFIDAWGENDFDFEHSMVTILGYDVYGRWVTLASINVREYNSWRGFIRPGRPPVYPGPGPILNPGPVYPPNYPPTYPPTIVPTIRWTPNEFGPVVGRKFFGLSDTMHINLNDVTEFSLRPAGNDVTITSVYVIDSLGNRFLVPEWSNVSISNGQTVSRRISNQPMSVRSIEIYGDTSLFGSSKVEVFGRAGLAR